MKKIIHVARFIRPGGGPAGYLYNLNEILTKNSHKEISVYSFKRNDQRQGTSERKLFFLDNLPIFFKKKILIIFFYLKIFSDIYSIIRALSLKSNNVHYVFHDQMLAYAYQLLTNKKFSVMPHQPVEFSKEVSEVYSRRYNIDSRYIYDFFIKKEYSVYKSAAKIIVPHIGSIDGYEFYDMKQVMTEKLFFILSYAIPPQANKTKETFIVENNFLNKKRIVGFFGRYTNHKGFDIFKSLITENSDREDLYFISAGAGDIKTLSSKNYHDFGWYSDIGTLISCCDIVIIPNRYSYFDLLPLECLLLGIKVLITNTGGSKFLIEHFSKHGVFEFSIDEPNNSLNDALNKLDSQSVNLKTIKENFNEATFLSNHLSFFREINGN